MNIMDNRDLLPDHREWQSQFPWTAYKLLADAWLREGDQLNVIFKLVHHLRKPVFRWNNSAGWKEGNDRENGTWKMKCL